MNKQEKYDIESYGEIHLGDSPSTPISLGFQDSNENLESDDHKSMYKAAVDGNSCAAGRLLKRDPSLACCQPITETGDRALHVAVYNKNTKFVRYLVDRVNPSELELLDGRGYTACCYAATTGVVEVADILMAKNPNLGIKRNRHGTTPLQIAVFFGNENTALKLLGSTHVHHLLEQEWVDLLLVAVHSKKMYGVALKILEKNGSLAGKRGEDQQTALHVLAQLDLSSLGCTSKDFPKMKLDLLNLVEKLWAEMKKLDDAKVLELIKNPPILHDAAKVGNMELITMITRAYPDLLGHTNDEGHSIFHIGVMYQQKSMLENIQVPKYLMGFNAILEDVDGNNLLHLAGKLLPPDGLKQVCESDVQLKKDRAWFEEVEKIVPPFFAEKRNRNGNKPREVFWKEHKSLVEESDKHMKSTAKSGILVATIIMTVVFTAAFTPPGGYNQETGKPLLPTVGYTNQTNGTTSSKNEEKSNWFIWYVIFDVLALLSSTFSILIFMSILSSDYDKDQSLRGRNSMHSLHNHLRWALTALLVSLVCAMLTFLSAFFLVAWKYEEVYFGVMLPTYVLLGVVISYQFFRLFPKADLIKRYLPHEIAHLEKIRMS